ncbi:hypothetical protein RchiOBHm_Chr4g0406051 [Rosa chinensis]|uniref:Uncharacterized protein n=1 Tax=Rosa chinensis TaxID=74649 RepID=A0A2P6QU98_ROSCH|nr:hypothetical protein RchiOBHm_Chr4g0406051 [Rosa chinensis]
MQARVDPPLESIWVYTALTFRSRNHPKGDILDRIAAAKDLFQLLSSCSAPCCCSKRFALLVQVVWLAHDVVLDLFKRELGFKKEKKVTKEVKNLVGVIMGFISVCCSSRDLGQEDPLIDSSSGWSFSSLSFVWLNRDENVRNLLPLVSEEVIDGLSERDGDELLGWSCYCRGFFVGILLELQSWDFRGGVEDRVEDLGCQQGRLP